MKGLTLLANVRDVAADVLSSDEIMKLLVVRAVEAADMTPVLHTLQVAHFPAPVKGSLRGGYGLSAGLILVESHVFIHTWPEFNYMRFELSSCREFDESKVLETLKVILGKGIKIDYIVIPWEKKE